MGEIGIARFLLDLLRSVWSPLGRLVWKSRLLIFGLRNRLGPSMDSDTARAVAFGTLGGSVVVAIPYRDFGNPRRRIAALRQPYNGGPGHTLCVLEEFGRSWRVIWSSEPFLGYDWLLPNTFAVHDADHDGNKEISVGFASAGSAYEAHVIYLHVLTRGLTYCARVERNWADPAQIIPRITIEPADVAEAPYVAALERLCDKSGITKPIPFIDLDDPTNAVLRWHKENGDLKDGSVSIHLHEGPGPFEPLPEGCLDDGEYLWIAYFKGPVYGYIKSQNKHFIPYSPASIYGWVNCLVASSRYLWMGTQGDGIVRFDKNRRLLKQFILECEGEKADTIRSLERHGDYFLLNGEFEVPADVLEQPAAY